MREEIQPAILPLTPADWYLSTLTTRSNLAPHARRLVPVHARPTSTTRPPSTTHFLDCTCTARPCGQIFFEGRGLRV